LTTARSNVAQFAQTFVAFHVELPMTTRLLLLWARVGQQETKEWSLTSLRSRLTIGHEIVHGEKQINAA
jgi:hypothetical protein